MQLSPFQVNKSLVLLDLSTTDTNTLKYLHFLLVQKLALKELSFLHVIQKESYFSNFFFKKEAHNKTQFILNEDIIKTFQKNVTAILSSYSDSIIKHYDVVEGQVLNVVIDNIETQNIELVILGKKDKKKSSAVLGNNIIRMSPCPVLFIPENSIPKISHISVAIDFSSHSGYALQTALSIANALPQTVTVDCVYVYDIPNFRLYKDEYSYSDFKTMLLEKAEKAFETFLGHYAPNISIEKRLIEHSQYNIASHLFEDFNSHGTDLVLIGAKGHSPMKSLLLGSVTEKLLQLNESIPTLIVR